MKSKKVILLHTPSVYDFRKISILRGLVNDLVSSPSIFEMYPIGFVTISAHLEDHGYPVHVINLAAQMLHEPEFEVEAFIKNLSSPLLFGIDLHWLPHTQGLLEIAKIVKPYHPDSPVSSRQFKLVSLIILLIWAWFDDKWRKLQRLITSSLNLCKA